MSEKDELSKKWYKRYFFEYVAALILLAITNVLCIPAVHAAATLKSRMILMLPPCIAILLMGIVIFRHYLRIDEFLRGEMVQSLAVAAAFTYLWITCYGVCESAGFPRISIWWVWGSMTVVHNLWFFGKRVFRR